MAYSVLWFVVDNYCQFTVCDTCASYLCQACYVCDRQTDGQTDRDGQILSHCALHQCIGQVTV